jgi:hypothetical protein
MSERKPKADGGTLDVKTMDALPEARSKPPAPDSQTMDGTSPPTLGPAPDGHVDRD